MANVVNINVRANDQTRGFAGVKAGLEQALSGLGGIAKAAGADMAASLSGPIVAAAGVSVAAFASVGAALGAFGLAVGPQIAKVTDLKAELSSMPPATREAAVAFRGLTADFNKWSDSLAPKTMPVFTKGIEILRSLLPSLTPLVNVAADALSNFMGTLQKDVAGGGIQKFIGKLADAARTVLPAFLNSLKNVVVGLGGMIGAFLPFTGSFAGGIEKMTAKFAAFGQQLGSNPAFQKWMQDMQARGPVIIELLGNLVKTILSIAQALAPFTGITLAVAAAFAKLVAAIPQGVMDWLAPAIAGIVIAIKAWAVVQGVLNIALAANPIGIVVLAIAGLVAGLIYAYKHSEKFRNIVDSAWATIKGAVSGAWKTIKPILSEFASFIEDSVVPAVGKLVDGIAGVGEGIGGLSDKFKDLTGLGASGKGDKNDKKEKGTGTKIVDFLFPVKKIGDALKKLDWAKILEVQVKGVTRVLGTLKKVFSNGFKAVNGVLKNFYEGAIDTVETFLSSVASKILSGVRRVVSFFLSPWPGAQRRFNGFMRGLQRSVSNMISNVAGALRRLPGTVAGIASRAWTSLSSQLSRVAGAVRRIAGSMWNAIPSSLRNAASQVYGILGGLAGYVGSVLSNIAGRIAGAIGSIPGFASGGIVGAAGGGPRSNLVMVGEQGRELVRLPFGSTVMPHGQTEGMMAGGGGGGRTVIEIKSGGSRMDDMLVELLRNAIRVRGGNVQSALGR